MAEGNKFDVEIITPDRIFFQGEADFLEFTTSEGEVGIYKNHIPLTNILAPGVVSIHDGDEIKLAAVHAGFVEILGEKVTFLAELAEWPDEIDVSRAESAKARAEERLAEKAEDLDIKRAEYALRKALIRIDIAGK